jgi:quercetin dioxygenase-like cupin family protein
MKKIALVLILPLAVSLAAIAAQKKEAPNLASKVAGAATTEQHSAVNPADLKWMDAPPGLPAGAKMAVLDGDPTKKGSFTVRLQAPTGYKIPPHTHPTAERITVISGSFHLGMGDKFDESAGKELEPGGFAVMPAGMKHFAWSSGEAVVQINSEGPFVIKYVNPADDPRNAKQ